MMLLCISTNKKTLEEMLTILINKEYQNLYTILPVKVIRAVVYKDPVYSCANNYDKYVSVKNGINSKDILVPLTNLKFQINMKILKIII